MSHAALHLARVRATRAGVAMVAAIALAACGQSAPGLTDISIPTAESSPMPTAAPTPGAVSAAPEPASAPGNDFYVADSQAAAAHAELLAQGRDDEAALIATIAEQPMATWLGDWISADAAGDTARTVTAAAGEAGQIAVFVLYAIPGRDCGLHSAGGLPREQYVSFVQAVADGIAATDGQAWVVLEPDALAQLGTCEGQGDRAGLLAEAAWVLDEAGADVFLDAGHSQWNSADVTVQRIEQVGTEHLRGFATNTSNYQSTADERVWAEQVAARTDLDFVVDTSRNGKGSNGEWCNARGRALGEPPAWVSDGPMLARLWIKAPGESDGQCNGGPAAGQWWPEIALELASNADA